MTSRELWRLVDSVRDRSYDVFAYAEKRRRHDLVFHLKAKGTVSLDDVSWLKRTDQELRAAALDFVRWCRRGRS